jgi:hypothetical protein
VVEKIESEQLIYTNICRASVTESDIDDVIHAFDKVTGVTV